MADLGWLERLAVASGVASLLAVAVPTFVQNLRASRTLEPIEGLGRLAREASALSALRPMISAYPPSAPLTPAEVPQGARVEDPPGTWDHPTWRELQFGFTEPHAYAFSFESTNGEALSEFRAEARGDLDGDGAQSRFWISGRRVAGGPPEILPLEVEREVE